jgi:hypothetical protein
MPRFLIEIPHQDEYAACVRALHALSVHGSHFVTHAEFGCADGAHTGWLIVDVDSRNDALGIVPPEFRSAARVVQLRKFTREEIENMLEELKP